MLDRPLPKDGLQVKRSNAGFGLFAKNVIPKGQFIIEYVGPILTTAEADAKGGKYLFEISNRRTIDGSVRSNIARYINHSCKPNCEPWNIRGRIKIYALRKIQPGEELTYNYGPAYFETFLGENCLCAACVEKRDKLKSSTVLN